MESTKKMAAMGVFLSFCFLQFAGAGEGFSSERDKVPRQLRDAWDSTFFVSPVNHGMLGSGFIIRKSIENSQPVTWVLTSGHVIESICGPTLGPCENLAVGNDQVWNTAKKINVMVNKDGATVIGGEVVARQDNPDLALLKIKSPPQWLRLRPIAPATTTTAKDQTVVVIGHPVLVTRTNWKTETPPNPDLVLKRVSRGFLLNTPYVSKKFNPNGNTWLSATADGLEGNSGSAGLNTKGEYVGLFDALGGGADGAYSGREDIEPKVWHSQFVQSEDIQKFLNEALD